MSLILSILFLSNLFYLKTKKMFMRNRKSFMIDCYFPKVLPHKIIL